MIQRRRYVLLAAAVIITGLVRAQPRPDDYGGLASYPVPNSAGGPSEFRYCVVYAKRAWRAANVVADRTISHSQAKRWATDSLGTSAAAEEIADFEKLETKEYPTAHFLAAARFYRCAMRLKLDPTPQHQANAELCFRSIALLDLAARLRAEGKSQEQTTAAIVRARPEVPKQLVDSTVAFAFTGPPLDANGSLIEDIFSECFAQAGTRQDKK